MFTSLKRVAVIIYFILLAAVLVQGEGDLGTIRKNLQHTVLKTNYCGEYTISTFRFGRCLDEIYRIWVKDGVQARETEVPIWQRGEVIIQDNNNNTYTFYIPALTVGLRISSAKPWNYLQEFEIAWARLDTINEGTPLFNRETIKLIGEDNQRKEILWVSKKDNFPLQMEIYNRGLLVRSFKFYSLEALPEDFDPYRLIPNQLAWYHDENSFWQNISIPRLQLGVSFKILKPTYLPEGYFFKKANLQELSLATVVHLIYEEPTTNKIISIFEREKLSERQQFNPQIIKKLLRQGNSTNVYQEFNDQIHLVIIGPEPKEELKKIAASMNSSS